MIHAKSAGMMNGGQSIMLNSLKRGSSNSTERAPEFGELINDLMAQVGLR
jgi:hypothetical protein